MAAGKPHLYSWKELTRSFRLASKLVVRGRCLSPGKKIVVLHVTLVTSAYKAHAHVTSTSSSSSAGKLGRDRLRPLLQTGELSIRSLGPQRCLLLGTGVPQRLNASSLSHLHTGKQGSAYSVAETALPPHPSFIIYV